MDTKKLRQKILDLAIHGKLVPQDPNDEPASVLLERIKAEKERLIKEGKIKRSKKSAKTSDTPHYPYLLPKGWEWSKLETFINEATDFVASGSFASLRENVKYYDEPKYAVLVRTKDFQSNFTKDLVYTDKQGYEFLSNSNLFGGELILPNIGASIGKVFIVPNLQERMTLAPNSIMIRCYKDTHKEWLQYLFLSPFGQEQLRIISSSTAQGKFNKTDLRTLNIPIPPLAEQERIVTEIKRWFTLIDEIEQSKFDLQNIISQTKSKILDLAIHGKLVPQNPNDEPAIELLKRINPDFTPCDNGHYPQLPFEAPQNWSWTTLGKIGKWQSGSTPNRLNKDYYNGNIPWLKTGDLNNGYITHIPESITEKALNETSVKLNPTGSVLIAMYGATIGKIGILTFPATTNQACCACEVFNGIDKEFLFLFLLSHREEFIKMGGGGAQPNISKEKIINTYIPLPPFAEQKRIVNTVNVLFTKLDDIMESL